MKQNIELPAKYWALLYRDGTFVRVQEGGTVKAYPFQKRWSVLLVAQRKSLAICPTLELATKDQISVRLNWTAAYQVVDPIKVAELAPAITIGHVDSLSERLISTPIVEALNAQFARQVASMPLKDIMENQESLGAKPSEETEKLLADLGLQITQIWRLNVNLPKNVQVLHMKVLEAQIRATSDLEMARTSVAVARTLKNAAELMENNESHRLLRYLETLERLASKGSHTFVLGEPVLK